jgi:two-component system NtrC family sensor kinase
MESDLPVVAGDQAQLQQVFLNLLTNAIDAIGDNGTIEVVTTKTNDFISASIKDDGPGIAAELQKRVFDPFITTKQVGKGVGLGLWVSYNIMEKMGGSITVNSEEGIGATFTVEIPIVFPEKK